MLAAQSTCQAAPPSLRLFHSLSLVRTPLTPRRVLKRQARRRRETQSMQSTLPHTTLAAEAAEGRRRLSSLATATIHRFDATYSPHSLLLLGSNAPSIPPQTSRSLSHLPSRRLHAGDATWLVIEICVVSPVARGIGHDRDMVPLLALVRARLLRTESGR